MDANYSTKAKVTEEGLLIPAELLEGIGAVGGREVEIRREPGRLVVVLPGAPSEAAPGNEVAAEDPILGLGSNPLSDDSLADASKNHDHYLYGAPRR